MTVKELIKELQKCDQDAIIMISNRDSDTDWTIDVYDHSGEKVRCNTMKGWGEDQVFSGYVCLAEQEELCIMEPEDNN